MTECMSEYIYICHMNFARSNVRIYVKIHDVKSICQVKFARSNVRLYVKAHVRVDVRIFARVPFRRNIRLKFVRR